MARRAKIMVTLVEHGDEITLHFEDGGVPPLWFSKKNRPKAHEKLKRVLDEAEFMEEIPVVGNFKARSAQWSGWSAVRSWLPPDPGFS